MDRRPFNNWGRYILKNSDRRSSTQAKQPCSAKWIEKYALKRGKPCFCGQTYCFLWSGSPCPPVCVSIFGRHMQGPVLRWQNIKTTLWDTFWDIVGHCEIIWNISRHYKTLWCRVRYCLTFRDIVKHCVSAYLWDICRAQFSWRRIFKTPFQLCFVTQNEFCHLQKTLMNRIYIAEWNLKIFHQKESFCKNVISKIIFGRIFANYPGQNWAVEQFSKTMLTRDPRQRVSNHSSFEGRGEFLGKPHNKNYIVYLEGSLSFFVHI